MPKIVKILGTKKIYVPGWLNERFPGHFARVSTDVSRKIRSSILDVARFTYGKGKIPQSLAKLCARITVAPQGLDEHQFIFGYEEAGQHHPGSIETDPALKEYISKYPDQWAKVLKVLGLPRTKSQHASAYVVTARPVSEFLPLTTIKNVLCTEYTANTIDGINSIESLGAIKLDLLRLKSLIDIQDCISAVQQRYTRETGLQVPESIDKNGRVLKPYIVPHKGDFYDVWNLPEDPGVFEDISKGRTETVFQLNTSGAKKWLTYFDGQDKNGLPLISTIRDISIFTALDRKGPLDVKLNNPDDGTQHNALIEYVRRRKGLSPTKDIPEAFRYLLPDTEGLLIFQEGLSKTFMEMSGCTPAEAEEFRNNISKKKIEKVNSWFPKFLAGASQKIGEPAARALWNSYSVWSGYGFNQSHALSYAVTAYACAFLKHHYPLEWWASVLHNAPKNKVFTRFWGYCHHYVDFPDIRTPASEWKIVGDRIQAPIGLLKGVGKTAQRQIANYGPYSSLEDFLQKIIKYTKDMATTTTETVVENGIERTITKTKLARSAIHSGVVYSLIISGVMDGFFDPGATLLEKLSLYEKTWATIKGKKKPDPVDQMYHEATPYDRFLYRKQLLPLYPENLNKLMVDCKHPKVLNIYGPQYEAIINGKPRPVPLWGLDDLEQSEGVSPAYGGLYVAMSGYILKAENFTFSGKTACKIHLNVDGQTLEFVKWPDWDTEKLDKRYNNELTGSAAVLVLNKRSAQKPFSVYDMELLAVPKKAT